MVAACVSATACACGSSSGRTSPDASLGQDAQPIVDAAVKTSTSVSVGTGKDAYQALNEGQMVSLTEGPQGGGRYMGYHIWSGVSTKGFDPSAVTVDVAILDAMNSAVLAHEARLIPLERNGDTFVAYGIAPRISDCCLAESKPVTLRAHVTDRNGLMGSDQKTVIAGPCLNMATGARVCP
jgi:hypothetical protein